MASGAHGGGGPPPGPPELLRLTSAERAAAAGSIWADGDSRDDVTVLAPPPVPPACEPPSAPAVAKVSRYLLPHEVEALASGMLRDITHRGATSVWLSAPSLTLSARVHGIAGSRHSDAEDAHGAMASVSAPTLGIEAPQREPVLLYRPMGDAELLALLRDGTLPATQPYQAVMEGAGGRAYAEKYLNGRKWVDTHPTSVVEFCVPASLHDELYALQHKVEDGAVSMGLGSKAGGGLPLLNAALTSGAATFRLVKVKRSRERAHPSRDDGATEGDTTRSEGQIHGNRRGTDHERHGSGRGATSAVSAGAGATGTANEASRARVSPTAARASAAAKSGKKRAGKGGRRAKHGKHDTV